MKIGKLFVFSGVSGVGKNTILNELFKDDSLNLEYSISMTTRNKRYDEEDGKNYFFVDKKGFEEAINNDELLEYAEFCGNFYGTPKKFVLEKLNQGKNVLLEIEVKGALNIMKKMPEAISIFILPPSLEELDKRLHQRGTESDDIIMHRLEAAKKELSYKEHYDYHIVNENVSDAVNEVKKIIKSGKKKN